METKKTITNMAIEMEETMTTMKVPTTDEYVDATTDVVAPNEPLEKGKREAEDAIEDDVLNAKRQKLGELTTSAKNWHVVSMQKKDESSSFEFGCDDETSIDKNVATPEKAPAVPTNQDLVIPNKNKDESSSDVGSAGESDVTAKNSLTAAKKKILSHEEQELDIPMTPVTPKEHITGSKTLFVGNLSFAVEQEDVEHFFKASGEVVNIRFGMNLDETFRGFGYVEFASAEAAEKALHELNGKELLRRPVRLDIAKERRSYAPYSGKDNQFIQEGGRDQRQIIFDQGFNKFDEDKMRSLVARFGSSSEITRVSVLKDQGGDVKSNYTETSQMGRREGQRIFVRGFNKFDGEDQIRSSLEEHFGSCGEIVRVSIPMDQDGAVKGIALIEFKDNDAFNQALKLDGSKFRGSALSVEEARPRRDTGGSGRGIGRGWRSGGWDFGGRSSWRSGDFDGSSLRNGGWDSSGRCGSRDFSWTKNYSSYEAGAATNVVVPKKLLEKGNWETEDAIIDDVLNAKRQKLEESTVQAETKPKTSVTPKEQITGLKTLYVGNLSFDVEQDDVENFFKAAGEVVNIRFGMNSDETFRGFGYVEFASAEAAEKALHELNGKELLRRPVRLDIVKERRSYAPYSGNDSHFIQKGGRGQGQMIIDHGLNKFDEDKMRSLVERFGSSGETTRVSILKDEDGDVKSISTESSPMGRRDQGQRIFVRGLNKVEGEDQIRSSLEEHFGSCGEITRVSIPRDEYGALKGIALIEFKDSDAFNQALKLDGSKFGGSVLSVEEARTRRDTGGSGLGRGRGWRSGGWDFGGRSSWRSGGGDFGGRSSWRSGEDYGGRSSWRSGGGEFGGRSSWKSEGGDFGGNSWRSSGWGSGGRSVSRESSWSKTYFSYEVDAAIDVVAPMISFEKGKREAEDAIEDEVLNAKKQKLEVTTVQAETKVVNKVEISNESFDSSSQNQTSLDEGIAAPNEAPTTPNAKKLVVSMQKKDESSSFEFGCDDENSTDENVVTAKNAPAVPTKDESSSAGEDDTAKNFATKENVSNNEPELDNLKTPAIPKENITGSKTLYVGNLSFAVEQKDVEHFFKDAAEIVNIRLIMNSDATFRGFGYVEFASAEAAEKALHELNGKELLCRPVRLEIAKERRSYAPYNSNDTEPSQMGRRRDQGQRIFVCGFNKFDGEDKIRSSLEEHFGSCGEITRVSIPMDQDGSVKGIALIQFKDTDAFNQALKLNGSKFGGSSLSVEEARPRPDTGGSFHGRGRGLRGGGRDSGGSSWRSGGGDIGGNSWSTGDFGGNSWSNSGGRSSWRSGSGDFGGNSWSNSGGRSSWRSGGGDSGGNSWSTGDFGGNSWSSGDVGGNSWRSGGPDSGGRGGSRDFSWRRPARGGGGWFGGGGRGR